MASEPHWAALGKETTECAYFLHHVSLSAPVTAEWIFIQFETITF